jgi:glucuronate isomerase
MPRRAGPSSCTSARGATSTPACSLTLGRDTGFDSIGDWPQVEGLAAYLDLLEQDNALPKTILYNNNPSTTTRSRP